MDGDPTQNIIPTLWWMATSLKIIVQCYSGWWQIHTKQQSASKESITQSGPMLSDRRMEGSCSHLMSVPWEVDGTYRLELEPYS